MFHHHPLVPPHIPTASRYHGFGRRTPQRTICNTEPPIYFILHLAWDYLTHSDRFNLASDLPVFTAYARLRQAASAADISSLLQPRPAPDATPVDQSRVECLAHALLRFNCDYGDLIRWLGGPYTDAHRPWEATFALMDTVRNAVPPDKFPSPDYERTFRACTEGVPLKANYRSKFSCCSLRNLADLSPDLLENSADVDETLRKE
jgi:hypothetical protein